MNIINKRNITLFQILLLIFFYESYEMFITESATGTSYYNLVVLTLFAVSLIISLLSLNRSHSSGYIKKISTLVVLMYLFSLLSLESSPFPAQIFYFTLIMPLPLLYSVKDIFREVDTNIKLILVLLLFGGLLIYYIKEYQANLPMDLLNQSVPSYTLLYFLPFILCIKKNTIKIIGILVVFVVLLMSLKRGGIMAFAIGLLSYYLFEMSRNKMQKKERYRFIIFFLLIAVCGFYVLSYFENISDEAISNRFNSISDDEGSGRIEAWTWVFKNLESSNFLEWMFGHGWNSVYVQSAVRSAHNDFLELLYDFGVITFVLYLQLYKSLFSASLKLRKEGSEYASPMFCSTIILLTNSLVSHVVFYPKYLIIYCLFWAFIESQTSLKQNYSNIKR